MNRLFKGVYVLGVLLLIGILTIINLQNQRTTSYIQTLVTNNAKMSIEAVQSDIEYWLDHQGDTLEVSRNYININAHEPEKIEAYLTQQMKGNLAFSTLYYGDENGNMINGTGFTWPESIDVRTRPWYVSAKEKEKLVITEPFQNALKDESIISVALPIFTEKEGFIGVIGGDIAVSALYDHLNVRGHLDNSVAFLLAEPDQLVVTSEQAKANPGYLDTMWEWYRDEGVHQSSADLRRTLDGSEGIFHFQRIADSNWLLLTFTELEVYSSAEQNVKWMSIGLIALTLVLFLILFNLQSRFVTRPLMALEKQVSEIDIEINPNQEIQIINAKAFDPLVAKINTLLKHISVMVSQLQDDRDEFQTMTEEIEAAYHQMVAAEQEMSRQKLCFEALFRNTQDAIVMFDQKHKILEINDKFTKLFDYTIEEIQGLDLDNILSSPEQIERSKSLTKSLFKGNLVREESVRIGKGGRAIAVEVHGVPMLFEGEMVGGYGIYTDISDRVKKEQHLAYMSIHDDLTDLFNRGHLKTLMVDLDAEENLPLGMVMLDINGLKMINDAFGTLTGDRLLIEIAQYLRMNCKATDLIARMGGDEFVIFCPNTPEEAVEALAKQVKTACKDVSTGEVSVSVSVGWAMRQTMQQKMSVTLKTAEDYMNHHKLSEGPSVRGKAIYAMIKTLHEKNKREEQHSIRVSELSERLGKRLGLSSRDVNTLKTMGLLHDIGKIAIDDHILNKNTHLTKEEYDEVKKHPEIGYRILSSVNEMSEMAEHVLAHHERWDGKGYPKGLVGDQIPYLSRIISVVDAFDAMTSDRSYRKGMPQESAILELMRFSGIQFDPEIVNAFILEIEPKNV